MARRCGSACTLRARRGLVPFGVEALLAMRVEKRLSARRRRHGRRPCPMTSASACRLRGDFIERRSLRLPEALRPDRLQLVGLRCIGPTEQFMAGGHLVAPGNQRLPQQTEGYLTSACHSPTLDRHIGLGLLRNGRARLGEIVDVVQGAARTQAQVVPTARYDPNGERLND